MLIDSLTEVSGVQLRVAIGVFGEQSLTQTRERSPVVLQGVNLAGWNTTVHGGVQVYSLRWQRRGHIPRDVEVVVIGANLITGHDLGEVRHVFTVVDSINDALDVAGTQVVVLALLNEALRSIDEQHVIAVTLLLEHQDVVAMPVP